MLTGNAGYWFIQKNCKPMEHSVMWKRLLGSGKSWEEKKGETEKERVQQRP